MNTWKSEDRSAPLSGDARLFEGYVPLNDKAAQFLAGKSEVPLMFQVVDSPGWPPLNFERAYFDTGEPTAPPPRR